MSAPSHPSAVPSLAPGHLNLIVPLEVTYDGEQIGAGGVQYLAFTDLQTESSFCLRKEGLTSVRLARRVGEMRGLHRAKPSTHPLPPAWTPTPRLCPDAQNHY